MALQLRTVKRTNQGSSFFATARRDQCMGEGLSLEDRPAGSVRLSHPPIRAAESLNAAIRYALNTRTTIFFHSLNPLEPGCA